MNIIKNDTEIIMLGAKTEDRVRVLRANVSARKFRAALKITYTFNPKGKKIEFHELSSYLRNDYKNWRKWFTAEF